MTEESFFLGSRQSVSLFSRILKQFILLQEASR
jgi:hypothetical protein